jgi:hypothetical protein
MNTPINQTLSAQSNPVPVRRIILASANRQERHSASRQERAVKTLRKMGRFDHNDMLDEPRGHRISSAEETWDD